ncbi:hypothetical protein ACP70R_032571 [Stipagrostis hirtigluma subsp. patula]
MVAPSSSRARTPPSAATRASPDLAVRRSSAAAPLERPGQASSPSLHRTPSSLRAPLRPHSPSQAADGHPVEGGGGVRCRGVAEDEAGSGIAGRNSATIVVGDSSRRVAYSVVPRKKTGGGKAGSSKRWLAQSASLLRKRRTMSVDDFREAAIPLGRTNDARYVTGRAYGDSRALKKSTVPLPPLAASKDGVLLGAASSASVLKKVSPKHGARSTPLLADNSHQGPEAGVVKSSGALAPNDVAASDGLLDTSSQRKLLMPTTRLPPKPRMVYGNRRFPPGYGKVAPSLIAGGGSNRVRLLLEAEPVVDGMGLWRIIATSGGTSVVGGDAMEIVALPSCNGTEDGTSRGYSTDELTRDFVMRALMPSNKCGMTLGTEDGTSRGYFGPKKKVKDPANLRTKAASSSKSRHDDILKALAIHEGKYEVNQHVGQNADDRRNVMMTCKRFILVYRTIVQAVEQYSLKISNIDLAAAKLMTGFTKHDPIVGEVPGVEVGDEFPYRVLVAIVRLHRPYQAGIDTTRDENGMLIAISIVASGGYDDISLPAGELIYTGVGGRPTRLEGDQKLEGGNLALCNCIKTKTPVRVIYRIKDQNREECSHSRAKQIPTFTYDGLYHVVQCWTEGQLGSKVFKYHLQKIQNL